jgi:hydrogenase 3 maturation protease
MADNQLLEKLDKLRGSRTVIVGVGNVLKGDDGAGPLLCQKLHGKINAELIDAGSAPENFLSPIIKKAPQNLLIIDAVDFASQPGTLKIFMPEQIDSFAFSTHVLSPHLFADLLRKSIDINVYIIGVQPQQMALGLPISDAVEKAIDRLAELLISIFGPVNNK